MKPLSSFKYYAENRKKFVTAIITVLVAVVFIYDIQCFTQSIKKSMYGISINSLESHARIYPPNNEKLIPETLLDTIRNNENVEKVIPCIFYSTNYIVPGSMSDADILVLKDVDMDYVMKKHNISIKDGRLPKAGKTEIALDYRVAKNKKVTIGDKIGSEIDKSEYLVGEYTIVGILNSEDFISLSIFDTNQRLFTEREQKLLNQSALVFPKENKMEALDTMMTSLPSDEIRTFTYSQAVKSFSKSDNIQQILDILCILSIAVMIISVGSSKYVQFFNRKKDFGVLNAMGYSKLSIILMTLKEVCAINLLGYVLGITCALIVAIVVNTLFFVNIGGIGVFFSLKALLITIYIPLFTSLFTFIPINNMINKIDPISMIEKA